MADDASAGVRGFWSGTLTFGLVSIPVELYPGVRSNRPALRTLGPDGAPLRRAYFDASGEEVADDALVRGFEVDGRYLTVTDEELEALEPERTRDIVLRRFVPRDAIGPAWLQRAYLFAPGGESTRPYAVLADTMERSGRAGIATFVMRGREHLVAVLADGGVLRAVTLRFEAELRGFEDVGLDARPPADGELADAMREALGALEADALDEELLEDERSEALRALARGKAERGEDIVEAPEGAEPETGSDDEESSEDLVAVLKRRLKARRHEAEPRAERGAKVERGDDALEEQTKDALYERAKTLDIEGRSQMSKQQLIASIREAEAA